MTYDVAGQQPIRPPMAGISKVDAVAKRARVPMLVLIVLLLLLTPAYFYAASLKLSPSKIAFLILVPVLTVKLLQGAYGRVLPCDYMVFGYTGWMTLSMMINHQLSVAVEYTGSVGVTLLGGYLTARAGIRSKDDFIALSKFLAFVILFSLPFALSETIDSKTTIPRWLDALPGIYSQGDINHEPRMGLWRVQFVFAHPIHYGLFCSLAFSLVLVGLSKILGFMSRIIVAAMIVIGCFLSVSSGPFLALGVQLALIGWVVLTMKIKNRWWIFWSLAIPNYIIMEIISERGAIYSIVTKIAFSSSTAFSRRMLYIHGMEQVVKKNPIFGIGYDDWNLPRWMTGSVDNFWLFLAGTFGVPAFLLFMGAFLYALIAVSLRNFQTDPTLNALRQAWMFTMISLMLTLGTVAIWGEIYSIALFMFGSGIWMLTADVQEDVDAASETTKEKHRDRTIRYTRFPTNHHDMKEAS